MADAPSEEGGTESEEDAEEEEKKEGEGAALPLLTDVLLILLELSPVGGREGGG